MGVPMKMRIPLYTVLLGCLFVRPSNSETPTVPNETTEAPRFPMAVSGFIEATGQLNLNRPESHVSVLRSYDNKADSLYLNAVHVVVSAAPAEGITVVAEVDAGSDAAFNRDGNVNALQFDLQEGYVVYVHSDTALGIKAGKFATFMGIEVIEGPDNPTVTRGFLFGLAEPFTHTGAVVTWKCGAFDVAAGVVNGWDLVTDNNSGKTVVGKATYGTDAYGATLSFLVGPEQPDTNHSIRRAIDLTCFVSIGEHRVNLQAIYGDDDVDAISPHRVRWRGAGIQPVIAVSEAVSVGSRLEHLGDPDGARTGVAGGASVTNVTVAPAVKLSKALWVRVEGRIDFASREIFNDKAGKMKDTQATLSLAVSVRF